jgi:hypothetical protein
MTSVERPRSSGGDRPAPGTGDAGPPLARRFSRRSVIAGLTASGLTAGLVGSLLTASSDTSDSAPSSATEAESAIVRIGRRYREERPAEDDREVLLDRLGVEAAAADSPDFLSSLDAQVADDYGAGRTVQLDGWVLSVTVGRAAALVSLS